MYRIETKLYKDEFYAITTERLRLSVLRKSAYRKITDYVIRNADFHQKYSQTRSAEYYTPGVQRDYLASDVESFKHGTLVPFWITMKGDVIDINSIVPDGILCLWSAWSIHRLTTSMPQAFHVAVKRNKRVTVPTFPQVEVHYYTEKVLKVGVSQMIIDGYTVNVYDVERSVCDAVKFRNKVGMDVCSEIINNYLERPERNISRLMDYARALRVSAILEKYLEVKL